MKSKAELRKEILQRRDALSFEERFDKSRQIAQKVIGQAAFQEADALLLFASYKSEVDTTEIFETAKKLGKDIYYPKVLGKQMEFYRVQKKEDLVEGYRGIREPEANAQLQFRPAENDKILVLMPGAVFDAEGNRIGYGGGYYDKFLQKIETILGNERKLTENPVCKMAVAYECQIVEIGQIPSDVYDKKVDYIITEAQNPL